MRMAASAPVRARMTVILAALLGAAAAGTVALAGTASSPRETDRGLSIPWEFRSLQHLECADTAPPPSDGWTFVDGDIELVGPGGVLRNDPAAERWEAGMPKCMNRIPVEERTRTAEWTPGRIGLQWLYYTGPLTACLAGHGIELPQPRSVNDFAESGLLESAYLNLPFTHSLGTLSEAYRECPPYPDTLLVEAP